MATCRVYKAQPIGNQKIEDTQIIFEAVIPEMKGEDFWTRAISLYEAEGTKLENALYDVLPGGTYDQLLRAMLTRRASLFSVSFRTEEE